MRALAGLLCLTLGVSCRSPGATEESPRRTAASTASATSAASAKATPPVIASQVEVGGLRVTTGSIARATLWGFSDLRVDLARIRPSIVSTGRGALLGDLLPAGALAIVNGGYFEADFKPSSWVKADDRELAPKTATDKGGVLAIREARPYIGKLAELSFEPELALQSFPLIVEPHAQPGIHRDDGRRAARTVACVASGALHFIVIAAPRGEGPTLFEADALLRQPAPAGFGCSAALNLDGGPSSGVVFGPSVAAKPRVPVAPVAYGIALQPR